MWKKYNKKYKTIQVFGSIKVLVVKYKSIKKVSFWPLQYSWLSNLLVEQVGDQLVEINGQSTKGMTHADAIELIKHSSNTVSLLIKRGGKMPQSIIGESKIPALFQKYYLTRKRKYEMEYKVLKKKKHTKFCMFFFFFFCLKPCIPFHIFFFLLNNIYCSCIMDIILYIYSSVIFIHLENINALHRNKEALYILKI